MVLDFTGLNCFFFFNLSVFDWVLLGYTGYNLSTVRVSFEYLSSIFRVSFEDARRASRLFLASLLNRVSRISMEPRISNGFDQSTAIRSIQLHLAR